MNINNAMIEITRRCNMKCEHCLRGDAENLDISLEHIDTFMGKVDYISSLTLTGGEPSLKPKLIRAVVQSAKAHNVDIGSFYIATNAKKIGHAFIREVLNLWLYCSDNEISCVHWSNDKYHKNDPESIRLLSTLSFASPKYEKDEALPAQYIIPEGRAVDWGQNKYFHQRSYEFEFDEFDTVEGDVYLNAKGNIVAGCDWSYESQEDETICKVEDLSIEVLKNHFE